MRALVRWVSVAALTTAILAVPIPTFAADPNTWPKLPQADNHPDPADRVWHRTGFYAGLVGGANIAQFEAMNRDLADMAWLGCLFAGFNVRGNGVVVGVEGDGCLTDIKANIQSRLITATASTDYLASLRARAGVPVGPALLYVTGGVAFAQDKIASQQAPTAKENKVGWVAGAGIEAELTKVVFVRLEALHYAFPDDTVGNAFEAKDQQTTARIGIGFKF